MSTIGFVVIYQWRLRPDSERGFVEIWSRNTLKIAERCGGLGSRLHKSEDGTWLAYAQWPDKETWQRSSSVAGLVLEGSEFMREAIVERMPNVLLEPVADLLSNVSTPIDQ